MEKLPLTYMSAGSRHYFVRPVQEKEREDWEFQCIASGRAHPDFPGAARDSTGPCLFVFSPGHRHGWTAPAGDVSEIFVLHLRPGAPGWERIRRREAPFRIPLQERDVTRIRILYEWIQPHFLHPVEGSRAILDSGCVLLADIFRTALIPAPGTGPVEESDQWIRKRVDEACRFFSAQMLNNPSVEAVARAVGVSDSQLRRLFAAADHPPPASVFRAMKMNYARRLLADTRLSVEEVAGELGFSSLSSFSRAYSRHFGDSPITIRRSQKAGA